jgi:hypothetical protein
LKKIYRGFPERLHHRVPHWVEPGTLFHIRIRLDREKEQKALIDPLLAPDILDSARFYEAKLRWHITLFLLCLIICTRSYLSHAINR